jgi:hypothetical protein
MRIQKFSLMILLLAVFGLVSCNDDDDNDTMLTGSAQVEITDAPIDDASVRGAFVTVSEVRLDGAELEGFNKATIDLLAYQNGNTALLGMSEFETGSYSEMILVLDYNTDENGEAPGCYVLDDQGEKNALVAANNEINIQQDYEIEQDQQTKLIVDFDLRKCINREEGGDDKYDFVTEAELESGVRAALRDSTGTVEGNCEDMASQSDKIIVYAYKKGSFDRDTELEAQGESNIRFSNAVTSTQVDGSGNYELHFLEKGEYEIHYASYRDRDNDGEFELQGTLNVNVLSSIDINSIEVDAASSTTVDVSVTGLLPL